jgi:hypothetical protein
VARTIASTRRVVERGEVDRRRAAPGAEPAGELAGGRGRRAAQGAHAEHGLVTEVVGEILHDVQGVGIGPVQVLQHHQQPAAGAEPAQQAQHGFAAQRGRLARGPLVGRRQPGQRHHRLERGQPRRELGLVRGCAPDPHGPQHRLGERAVRRARPRRDRPADRHQRALAPDPVDQLAAQPRLAQAWLAADHGEAAAPAERVLQPHPERPELGITPDEDRAPDPHPTIMACGGGWRPLPPAVASRTITRRW